MKKILSRNHFIFTDTFIDAAMVEPIVLLDVGARGGIESPWKEVDERILKVVGFEPDKDECRELNSDHPGHLYIPSIVWSEQKDLSIYVTSTLSCSSVYEPNIDFLKQYDQMHWEHRKVIKKTSYPATTIDDSAKKHSFKADIVKIDTQGSELEILKGAHNSLKDDIFMVIAETWLVPVYKDQPMAEEVISYMRAQGFSIFDIHVAAAWKKKTVETASPGKKQIIGLDLLFIKDISALKPDLCPPNKILKFAALTELYGYPDYALQILDWASHRYNTGNELFETAAQKIRQLSTYPVRVLTWLARKIGRRLGLRDILDYPLLHP